MIDFLFKSYWKRRKLYVRNKENLIYIYFPGLIVFFEEDHYVAPDFIHMLQLMDRARQSHCPTCRVLSLGTYLKTVDFARDTKKVRRVISCPSRPPIS